MKSNRTNSKKNMLINLLKLATACAIIAWLVYSGKLDFSMLMIVFEKPIILLSAFMFFALGAILLGSFRWFLLLKGAGYTVSYLRTIHLQLTGMFFNTAMPGAVGGDLVKAYYVIRDNQNKAKTAAIMSIFLDRLIGMSGVFATGLLVAAWFYNFTMQNSNITSFVQSLIWFLILFTIFMFAALYKYKGKDPFLRILSLKIPSFSIFKKIYLAVRTYQNFKLYIFAAILISIVNQFLALTFFYLVTISILPTDVPIASIASIFPIGVLTSALPLAPGGLGVGHAAFEKLFTLIGLSQGANIFNIYTLVMLCFNLTGFVPYLYLKRIAPIGPNDLQNQQA